MRQFMLIALVFLLGACSYQNNDTQNAREPNQAKDNETASEEQAEQNDQTDDEQAAMKNKLEQLGYKEIEIEVSYGDDKEYEAEIEQNSMVTAELEDELNDEYLKGMEAFDAIYPYAEQLSLTPNTDMETAINAVLDAFDLDADYEQFELEITFQDGKELEFEDSQSHTFD
ncbi:MAG TPA: YusW family protein [Bacillota bacterium]|nr:YusW family protein [Bacillota bacterium]